MSDALYELDGGRFMPSPHTQGPWEQGAQHGGAPGALLVRALEALPADAPGRLVRCTFDILRPVPLQPLRLEASVERPGRRVRLLAAILSDMGGIELCRMRAWWIRAAESATTPLVGVPFALPQDSVAHEPESDAPAFHRTGVEIRFATGSFWESGPAALWIRLRRPVIAGEKPSPVQRALAAADFGNGVSAAVPWGRYLYINTDLTVSLHREPQGEWMGLDATTRLDGGAGVAQSVLYDTRGRTGIALQTLLVEDLGGAARSTPPA